MTNRDKWNFLRKTVTLDDHKDISGVNFEKVKDFAGIIDSLETTGFQSTNLAKGITIVNQMIDDKAKIFLSFTGNIISSGLRDIITFLCKNKFVDAIVTSASGVEEDIIKSLKPFKIGKFEASGRALFEHGVGRIGNIYVPNDRYLSFEKFINPILANFGQIVTPTEITLALGKSIGDEKSYLYWCAKNNIPVYCPGIIDGAIGDLLYFERQRRDIFVDVLSDHEKIIDYTLNVEKIGAIILGGGIAKHYTLNSTILREGLDYAVYVTTATEMDGSDSGGNIDEAQTWAKVKLDAPSVIIRSEATLVFPTLVAATFAKEYHK